MALRQVHVPSIDSTVIENKTKKQWQMRIHGNKQLELFLGNAKGHMQNFTGTDELHCIRIFNNSQNTHDKLDSFSICVEFDSHWSRVERTPKHHVIMEAIAQQEQALGLKFTFYERDDISVVVWPVKESVNESHLSKAVQFVERFAHFDQTVIGAITQFLKIPAFKSKYVVSPSVQPVAASAAGLFIDDKHEKLSVTENAAAFSSDSKHEKLSAAASVTVHAVKLQQSAIVSPAVLFPRLKSARKFDQPKQSAKPSKLRQQLM